MAALTAIRDTKKLDSSLSTLHGLKQKGATKLWFGALAVLNAGYLAPGTAAVGLVAVGRVRKTSDNPGADGAVTAQVEAGTFKWANSAAGDAIAQADVGAQCFIVDDQTVAKTNPGGNTRSVAGIIQGVDSDGVWVQSGLGINS